MSLVKEGQSCPLCHAYLFEEDDVVYCPVCGAPHHRECYNKIGKCALEELHGTDRQYDLQQEKEIKANAENKSKEEPYVVSKDSEVGFVECPVCHESYDLYKSSCPKCETPNPVNFSGFNFFDFLGGVPSDYDIGDGVLAGEAKRFVASNTPRYIRKFSKMKTGSKLSWNWLAFLFPGIWFLSRKMYKAGIFASILTVAAELMSLPFNIALMQNSAVDLADSVEIIQEYISVASAMDSKIIILAVLGAVISIVLSIVCGIFADSIYRGYTINSIKEIKAKSEDIDGDFRKKGGIGIVAMLIGIIVVDYLPSIIISFF